MDYLYTCLRPQRCRSQSVSACRIQFAFASEWYQRYKLLGRLQGHTGPINCFAFTRDGAILASGGIMFCFHIEFLLNNLQEMMESFIYGM